MSGIAGLAATGASPRTITPLSWLTMGGAGLFFGPAFADIYGVAAPGGGTGTPQRELPSLEAHVGYRYVRDRIFDYGNFATTGLTWRWRPLRIDGDGWFALDDENWRLRMNATYRFIGPRPDRRTEIADGSFVELGVGLNHHRFDTEDFSMSVAEWQLTARLDLFHFTEGFRGSFAEVSLGQAGGLTHFDHIATEWDDLLLGRLVYGFYLGHAQDGWGEMRFFYDHRHDGYAAGLKSVGLGSGIPGHVGAALRLGITDDVGIDAEIRGGSAIVTGLSMVWRLGGSR